KYRHTDATASTATAIPAAASCRPSSRRPPSTTSTASGTRNWRIDPSSTNSHDHGCRRRSTPAAGGSGVVVIDLDPARELVAQPFGVAVVQAGRGDRVVAGAGGVDEQGGQAEPALDRAALQVQVLHPAARHEGFAPPQPAAA